MTSLKQSLHCAAAEADVAAPQEAHVRSKGGDWEAKVGGVTPCTDGGTQQNYSVPAINWQFSVCKWLFLSSVNDFYVSCNVKTATSCLGDQQQCEKQQNEAKV